MSKKRLEELGVYERQLTALPEISSEARNPAKLRRQNASTTTAYVVDEPNSSCEQYFDNVADAIIKDASRSSSGLEKLTIFCSENTQEGLFAANNRRLEKNSLSTTASLVGRVGLVSGATICSALLGYEAALDFQLASEQAMQSLHYSKPFIKLAEGIAPFLSGGVLGFAGYKASSLVVSPLKSFEKRVAREYESLSYALNGNLQTRGGCIIDNDEWIRRFSFKNTALNHSS